MRRRVGSAARRTFSSLAVPNYRLYFAGQSISVIGTWMQMTAQAWLVLTLTHSATALGLVVALQTIPVLIIGPYGGVVADRVDKRKLMVALQVLMAIQALTLGLLTILGAVRFFEVCLLATILGLNNAFEFPARQAFVREMVGHDHVRNAVTLNSVMANMARAVGPAIAGVLIATVGDGVSFLANAASFAAVVTSLLVMDRSALQPSTPAPRAKGQLREGLAYARRTPEIAVPLWMMGIVGMLAYEFSVSLPVLATTTFHAGAEAYGFMSAFMGIGAVIGGLFSAARGKTGLRPMALASLGFGIAILAVGLAPWLASAYAALVLVGWMSVSFISIGNSTIQLSAKASMRGRVLSLWQVAFQGTTPVGGPLIGWVIAASNPRVGLAVGAASALAAGIGGALVAKRHRRIEHEPPAAAELVNTTMAGPAPSPPYAVHHSGKRLVQLEHIDVGGAKEAELPA
jgi:MFS family permease